ncbi:hypothetical protein [Sphingomonas sp.]
MTIQTIGRQVVAIVATLLVSTACVVGAVGPATAHAGAAPVVAAARA